MLHNNIVSLNNKIEAKHLTLHEVLSEKKYQIDYFQREYNWQEKHVSDLIQDLLISFFNNYKQHHERKDGVHYNNYYLGTFIVSQRNSCRSLIDGQQRLTTITLFLIFLNHLQQEFSQLEKVEDMIFSDTRGVKSFNLLVPDRSRCLDNLFLYNKYTIQPNDNKSTINMAKQYQTIKKQVEKKFNKDSLPFFIDWLKYNVILVEVLVFSDENAYSIFESSNERGLNLTQTEMLKGFILSKIDPSLREDADKKWRDYIQDINKFNEDNDKIFFQSYLMAKHANLDSDDFKHINQNFQQWFKRKLNSIPPQNRSLSFQSLLENDLYFYLSLYKKILQYETHFNENYKYIYYLNQLSPIKNLTLSLFFAPIRYDDDQTLIDSKLQLTAKFLESTILTRVINNKSQSLNGIRGEIYKLLNSTRNINIGELKSAYKEAAASFSLDESQFNDFSLTNQNKPIVRHVLSRITNYIEQQSGIISEYNAYSNSTLYDIEHIIHNKYEDHKDLFNNEEDFDLFRNKIGALLLLPKSTNRSYNNLPYQNKKQHYLKENLLAQSLCALTYKNNPKFIDFIKNNKLDFTPLNNFNKSSIIKRQQLYYQLFKIIWHNNLH